MIENQSQNTSLSELQQHLAQRLSDIKNKDTKIDSWMLIRISDTHYAVPLEQLGEIVPWTNIKTTIADVPYTKDWFLGVTYYHGNLIGIVDFDRFLGKEKVNRSSIFLQSCHLLLVNSLFQVNVALLIDELQGLRNSADLKKIVDTNNQKEFDFLTSSVVDNEGIFRNILNLQELIQDSNFMQIRV